MQIEVVCKMAGIIYSSQNLMFYQVTHMMFQNSLKMFDTLMSWLLVWKYADDLSYMCKVMSCTFNLIESFLVVGGGGQGAVGLVKNNCSKAFSA